MKKAIMCFVALLAIAAAAGPVRGQNSYNVTFGGFNNPFMNTTVSVASLPETFAGVGVYDFYPFEVISDQCGQFYGASVTSGGDGKVGVNITEWNQLTITVTGTFEGTATIHIEGYDTEIGDVSRDITVACAVPPQPHTVRMAAGTEDAANWTLASGNASVPGTQVLEGVMSGSTLVATYSGTRKVKSVKAVRKYGMLEVPLTIEALTAGTVVVRDPQSGMQYTLNGGTKTAVSGNINVAAGDKVAFYGNGTSITSYLGTTIGGTAEVKAYGNIMSLVNETGFATATTLTANAAFSNLFGDYANLKDISGLLLPATTLTESCYSVMFIGCTGLTTVPSNLLPATTLAKSCYVAMFAGDTNLTNVPTLPATTLAELCYNNMFLACNGLNTVPTDLLPATTLAPSCYSYMFLNCSNLTTAPALPATTLAENCYMSMFANCTALNTVPSDLLPATTLAEKCYQQMFYGCENLAASPVLPATTLVSYCYRQMFYDCANLSSVTCLATSGINQNSSTEYWLDRAGDLVQGTKTVNAASSANWPMDNESGIPSGWTLVTPPTPLTIEALTAGTIVVQQPQSGMQYTLNGGPKTAMTEAPTEITVAVGDKVAFYGNGTSITRYNGTGITGGTAEVKAYGNIMSLVNETGFDTATTLTANAAFYYLFDFYTNLKDISGLLLPATTLTEECYRGMFSYCTGLTTVPTDLLPATTMARGCYSRMFTGCENLTNVPTLPATTLAMGCYDNMFSFCTGLTTVPTNLLPATTLAEGCYSSMFLYCLNLTTAPALPATTLAEGCYSSMFPYCLNLTTAPVLPATTLVGNCYQEMFYSCSKLSSVTCLATSGINQNSSTEDWLYDAGSDVLGTKTVNAVSTAEWPMNNGNGIPSGWTRQNIDN